jgi:hypothetical protein
VKRTWIIVIAALVCIAISIPIIHFYLGAYLASWTYDAAITADDAGDEQKAIELFKEACEEGSQPACQALREQGPHR